MAEGTSFTNLRPAAGDAPPPGVTRLLDGLETGDPGAAGAAFAAGAVCAWPAVEDDETAPRAVSDGEEIVATLSADPRLGQPHRIRLCCWEGADCLVEGWILDGDGQPARTFATSLQFDGTGQIARCLMFRSPPVEDDEAGPPGQNDIRALIDNYFENLHAARFEAAVANFADDCLYSHPPYFPGTPRAEFRGRGELLAGFRERGPKPVRVVIDRSIQRGADLLLEGHTLLDGTPAGPAGSFVSSAALDPDGKIRRYVAFHTMPLVARR